MYLYCIRPLFFENNTYELESCLFDLLILAETTLLKINYTTIYVLNINEYNIKIIKLSAIWKTASTFYINQLRERFNYYNINEIKLKPSLDF